MLNTYRKGVYKMQMPDAMVTAQTGFCPILKDMVSLTVIYNREKDGVLHLSEIKCPVAENPENPLPEDAPCKTPGKCPIHSMVSETK